MAKIHLAILVRLLTVVTLCAGAVRADDPQTQGSGDGPYICFTPVLQVHKLPANADRVAKALQDLYQGSSSLVRVTAVGAKDIAVYAAPDVQAAVAGVVMTLSAPAAQDERKKPAKSEYLVRITPTDFFSGELKRLKAHHDFTSVACFKIQIEGAVTCEPDVIMLRNGERVDRKSYAYAIDKASDEISLTLRECPPNKDESIWFRVGVGGIYTFSRYLERPVVSPPLEVAFGPVSIGKPAELKPGADSVVVWAMGGGRGVDLSKPGEVEEKLKRLPWAMILRLRAEKRDR